MSNWWDQAISDIQRDESCRLYAYQDSEGVWTIGFGHTGPEVVEGLTCSLGMATLWLTQDAMAAKSDLETNLPWFDAAPDPVKRGLVNMAFNLGWPRLREFSRMLAAGMAGNWGLMGTEALNSKWAGQVGERAQRIAELFYSAEQLVLPGV